MSRATAMADRRGQKERKRYKKLRAYKHLSKAEPPTASGRVNELAAAAACIEARRSPARGYCLCSESRNCRPQTRKVSVEFPTRQQSSRH